MDWKLEDFQNNNRKLYHYVSNAENGIILLCANNWKAVGQLARMLEQEYDFMRISFSEITISFPIFVEQYVQPYSNNRICLYHLPEQNWKYDLIKTMNISRDILRKIGMVVLILPNYAAEQVQIENPNLYDYITLRLDYNINYPLYLCPIYSEAGKYFMPRQVRTARKREVMNLAPSSSIKNIQEYYHYLETFYYKNMSFQEMRNIISWIFDYANENLQAAHIIHSDADYHEVRAQLYKKTAEVLCNQGFFQEALLLYDEIIFMMKRISKSPVWGLEAIQGKAFCCYRQGHYKEAVENLEILTEYDAIGNNVPWVCRIKNDQAVCLYKAGKFTEAIELLAECHTVLQQTGEYKVHRKFRVLYNLLLLCLDSQNSIKMYEDIWYGMEKEMVSVLGWDTVEYVDYCLLTGWIHIKKGKLEQADFYAKEAMRAAMAVLPENDERKIQVDYLFYLIGKEKNVDGFAEDYRMRAKKIWENCVRMECDYKEWLGIT